MQWFADGAFSEAIEYLQRAVHLQHVHATSFGMRPNFAVHEALAAAYSQQGRVKDAESSTYMASQLCAKRYGQDHPAYVLALINQV
jgi:Flp pilus assembly protein TadD